MKYRILIDFNNGTKKTSSLINKYLNYFVVFISAFLILTTFWIINNYASNANINAIIFHLKMPLNGANYTFYISFTLCVIIPSFIILLCSIFSFTSTIIFCILFSFIIMIFGFVNVYDVIMEIKPIYYKSFLFNDNLGILYTIKLILLLFIFGVIIFLIHKLSNRIKIKIFWSYLFLVSTIYSINKHFLITNIFKTKEYSSLYENNYKIPQNLISNNKRNLILILAESMEVSYAKWGGGFYNENIQNKSNLIPNLYDIANKNINFSNNDSFGGIIQTSNTSWTIAGTTGYLCGIPLSLPLDSNIIFSNDYINQSKFLPNATCISDILKFNNYNQIAFLGYDTRFAGSQYFFKSHNIDILDEEYFKKYGEMEYGFWGIKDYLIFEFVKDYLKDYKSNKPFALYIPTIDTHAPDGFVDKKYCSDLIDNTIDNAIICTDRIISEFILWTTKQDFYKNTTIIILGDHLSGISMKYKNRNIYNAFINAKFSKTPTKNLFKNRQLSHFDISPLILDSIGFRVQHFGLGINPLYQKTLLEEKGLDEINKSILKDSKLYESLWQ